MKKKNRKKILKYTPFNRIFHRTSGHGLLKCGNCMLKTHASNIIIAFYSSSMVWCLLLQTLSIVHSFYLSASFIETSYLEFCMLFTKLTLSEKYCLFFESCVCELIRNRCASVDNIYCSHFPLDSIKFVVVDVKSRRKKHTALHHHMITKMIAANSMFSASWQRKKNK